MHQIRYSWGPQALAKELGEKEVPIREASIGKVSRRDIRSASFIGPSFPGNYGLPQKSSRRRKSSTNQLGAMHIGSEIIYRILEEHEEWLEKRKIELDEEDVRR